jgi:hypothetical protein
MKTGDHICIYADGLVAPVHGEVLEVVEVSESNDARFHTFALIGRDDDVHHRNAFPIFSDGNGWQDMYGQPLHMEVLTCV